MPTARDATIAIVQREIAASAIISSFALAVKGNVSVGEKAVEFVKAENLVDNPENVVGVAMREDDRVDIARSDARRYHDGPEHKRLQSKA